MDVGNVTVNSTDVGTDTEKDVANMINIVVRPILVMFGTLGNTISFVVMRRGSLKQISTCAYLSLLALVDTGVLWSGCFVTWLGYVTEWRVVAYTWWGGFSCKMWYFTYYGFTHISTNTLTMTSVERVIIVYLPLKAKQLCKVTVAKRTIFVFVLIFTVFEAQYFFTIKFDDSKNRLGCVTISDSYSEVFKLLDSILYSYVPLSIMFICNSAIIFKLLLAKYTKTDSNKTGNLSLSKAAKAITIMLVSVSVLFIICTLPYAVLYQVDLDVSTYSYTVIILLMYMNHSVNIIVYSLTNSQFKKEIRKIVGCKMSTEVHPFTNNESSLQ